MKKLLGSLALWLALGTGAFAQNPTAVTGTITDPNSVAYYPAQVTACLSPVTSRPTVGGQLVNPNIGTNYCIGPVSTAPNGSFSMGLHANGNITPGATTWIFTVTTLGAAPPAGTGSQTFQSSGITISGASQDVGATLSALAPKLLAGGSSVSPNSPIPQSQVGPGFNVKNYGAKGDAQATGTTSCAFQVGVAAFTCTGTAFSAATDVSKQLFCSSSNAGASFFGASLQTIVSVQNGLGATASTTSGFTASGACVWGTLDDTAIAAAVTAAKAASKAIQSTGNTGIFTAPPRLYFPAGGYLLCSTLLNGVVTLTGSVDGFIIDGDGVDQTFLYPGTGAACPLTNNSTLGSIFQIGGSTVNVHIHNLTIDGVNNFGNPSNAISLAGSQHHVSDIAIQRWGGNSAAAFNLANAQNFYGERIFTVANQGIGFLCNVCTGTWESGGSSNNGNSANLLISGVIGSNTSNGFRLGKNILIDECGTNVTGCAQVANSNDVWFIGPSLFGTPNGFCLNVDANSYVHWNGGICGTFGNDNNTSGPRVALGGALTLSSVRSVASGTGKCITATGTILDNGDNSCETMFVIASGTSAGTAAVLTTTNLGAAPTANCSAGDSILVEGAGLAGYNGYFQGAVTATGANSISYTTVASNIGALSAGGVAHCRNLQTYTGTLPKALLNNPIPNTCYVTITPIVNATTYTLCNFRAQNATNITRIMASSQVVTTCATAPIITISDGTATQTLTLTTAKQSWDSAVDASTGVGTTIFKPNGTITVKYDVAAASACATPPTQLAISYNISPILSN